LLERGKGLRQGEGGGSGTEVISIGDRGVEKLVKVMGTIGGDGPENGGV